MRFSSATYTDDRIKRTSEIGEARSRRRNVAFSYHSQGFPFKFSENRRLRNRNSGPRIARRPAVWLRLSILQDHYSFIGTL